MTLKEQIKECKKIIAQLKKDIGSFEASSVIDNSYEEDVKRFTNYLNFYKDILNSLQVLEIFKKNTDVELLKANEKAPILVTMLRCKPLTHTVDKEYQDVKEWLEDERN